MSITFTCECGKRLQVGAELAGQEGRCPACGKILHIPTDDSADSLTPMAHSVRPPAWGEPLESSDDSVPAPDNLLRPPPTKKNHLSPGTVVVCLVMALGAILYMVGRDQGWFADRVGNKIQVTSVEEIYYQDVPPEQARRLGEVLQELRYFDGNGPKSVQLSRVNDRYVVKVVIKDGLWDDEATLAYLRLLGRQLKGILFDEAPVEVFACDAKLNVRRRLEPTGESLGKRLAFSSREEIFYRGVTEEETRRLGQFLRDVGCFSGENTATVTLSRDGDAYHIGFVVVEELLNDAEAHREFTAWSRQISLQVFQMKPVEIQFLNAAMEVKKTLR